MEKILHLAKHYYPAVGGIETATKDLAETAAELGCEVSCTAIGQHRRVQEYCHEGVKVRSFPAAGRFLSAPLSLSFFFRRLDRGTVVHLHLPNPLMELRVLLSLGRMRRRGQKLFPFFHSFPVSQGRLGRLWFALVTRRLLCAATGVLISDWGLVRSFPVLAEWEAKIFVLPFAAEPLAENECRRLLPARVAGGTVLAMGRLVPYKGFKVLLQAWASVELQPQFAGFSLRIVGHGPEGEGLRRMAEELGLRRVEFVGAVSDEEKQRELQRAALFVAPSLTRAETFGISVLEAMSQGLPVITTSLDTGLAALARGGDCGAVARPGQVAELAAEMEKLLSQPAISLETFGLSNLQFVAENYSRAALKQRYAKFLESIKG